jgi:hypothetical protein
MKYTVEIGSRCHNIPTKFHKDCFRHSKFDEGVQRHQGDRISQLVFIRNKERDVTKETFI